MQNPKINDKLLLSLINRGLQQKEVAKRLGVSPAAVCKRLKVLARRIEPDSLKKLTDKEKKFAIAKAQGQTNTQAALSSFEVTSPQSAKVLGHNLMRKEDVRLAIDELMEAEGIGRRVRVRKLKQFVDNENPHVGVKALDMGFKLANDYPAQRQINLNANVQIHPVDLSAFRNYEFKRKSADNSDVINVTPIDADVAKETLTIDKFRNRD